MNDGAFFLQRPFYRQELRSRDEPPILLKKVRGHEDVEDSRLVCDGEKNNTGSSTGTLFHDCKPCSSDIRAVGSLGQVRSPQISASPQFLTSEGHRMRAGCDAAHRIICNKSLLGSHRVQRYLRRIFPKQFTVLHEQWAFWLASTFNLPESIAS